MAVTTWSSGNCSITIDTTALDNLIVQTPIRAKNIIRKTAFYTQGQMMGYAAVETGAMKNSIAVVMKDQSTLGSAQSAAQSLRPGVQVYSIPVPGEEEAASIGPTVEYAIYVEFGTSRHAAQPFVVPGANDGEKMLVELCQKELIPK